MTGKVVGTLALLVLFTAVVAGPAAAAPKIATDSFKKDLGKVKSGTVVEDSITFRNDGDAPLEVLRLQSSCPCLTLGEIAANQLKLAPGAALEVPFAYDTKDLYGDQGAAIVVASNDPVMPAVVFDLTVYVDILLVVRPPKGVSWGLVPRGGTIDMALDFFPGDKTNGIELLGIRVSEPGLAVKTEKGMLKDTPRVTARFAVDPNAPLGEMHNSVTARLRIGDEETTVTLPLTGHVIGDVMVLPPAINSPKSERPQGSYISRIMVQSSYPGTPAPAVLGAIAVGPLRAVIHPDSEENQHTISVHVADNAPSGPLTGTVYVMVDSPDQPITAVPVFFRGAAPVTASPGQVVLAPRPGAPATQRVDLNNLGDAIMRIEDVRFEQDILRVETEVPEGDAAAKHAALVVTADALKDPVRAATMIVVRTNVPGAAELLIPVLIRPVPMEKGQ